MDERQTKNPVLKCKRIDAKSEQSILLGCNVHSASTGMPGSTSNSKKRVKERARVATKFMAVAKCLRELNNFNTLMSIVSGLNIHATLRLKHTFAAVKKNVAEVGQF